MTSIEQRRRDFAALVEFILNQAEHAPVKKRVPVYRALSILLGDTPAARQLAELAGELEVLEQQFREFAFTIDFTASPSTSGNGQNKNP